MGVLPVLSLRVTVNGGKCACVSVTWSELLSWWRQSVSVCVCVSELLWGVRGLGPGLPQHDALCFGQGCACGDCSVCALAC